MSNAEELKALGNKAFAAKDFQTAVKYFSQAIEADPSNHVLYSNRSACYSSLKEYDLAVADGEKTIELSPTFWKGYTRKAIPLYYLGRYEEARKAYLDGLEVDPNNEALQKGVADCNGMIAKQARPRPGPGGSRSEDAMASMFNADLRRKIAADPSLRHYLDQPDFVKILDELIADPKAGFEKHGKDERVMAVFLAQMKVKMAEMGMSMGDFVPSDAPQPKPKVVEDVEMPQAKPQAAAGASSSATIQDDDEEEDAMDTSDPADEDRKKAAEDKKQAEAEKEKGNAEYTAKNFEKALEHYSKAVELDPTNIVYRLNRAAVYMAQKEYEKCAEECDGAVEAGRSVRCDFTQIGKAYHRKGRALMKLKKYAEASAALQKSLTEHRTAPVLNDLQTAERLQKKAEAEAYYNPELAIEAKNRGNEFFKTQQFPEAVKEYSEAIARNPKDPAFYSNRAAAYSKLMAYTEALKDCDKCLELDPTFIKGYTRKAAVYNSMQDYRKAMNMWEAALKVDPNNQEVLTGYGQTMQKIQSSRGDKKHAERAMQDPEIQEILREDRVQGVLNLLKSDPAAAQRAISQSPELTQKFNILMSAGLL